LCWERWPACTGEEQKPVCRSCGKVVLAQGGSTTNLLMRLRDHHPQLHVEAMGALSRNPVVAEAGKNAKLVLLKKLRRSGGMMRNLCRP